MSYFKGLTLTKKGEQLQAKVNGNLSETLVFTKAKLGSGSIANDNEIRFLTDLKASWGEAMVSNCEIQGQDKDTVAIELQFSNQNLREDKIFREIGLYARGNDGQEVLYAYANAGENYDYIPIMQNSPHTFVIVIYFKITSGTKISATIDLKSYVTQEKLNVELAKKIDKTSISDSLSSTSQTTVLSSAGAKALEDKKFNKSGGELTGNLKILSGDYSQIQLGNTAGEYLILQNEPASSSKTSAGRIILRDANIELNGSAGDIIKIEIPKATGRMALEEWVNTRITWGNLPDKPSVFPPATHTHTWASLTGKPNIINVTDSTSTTDLASARAVKLAYDKGIEAMREAGTKVSKAGDTMTGDLNIKNGGDFSKIQLYNNAGQKLLIQSLSGNSDYIGNIALRNADYTGSEGNIKSLFIPKKDGVLAIAEDISKKHLEIVGKDYGGILNTAGAKTAGKTYFDNNTKKLFLCKNNNSDTSANVNNYIALDNNSILERLEKISNVSYLKKENGYLEINGFILQWGTGFTFAKPFPNACLRVLTSINTTGDANQNDDTMVTSFNKTGFTTLRSYYNVVYFAIGY